MSRLVVENYQISKKTGFLQENLLEKLPSYFDPWNDLAKNMTKHLKTRTLREEVLKLPLLDYTRLSGDREVKLAHVELTNITVGYMYQDGVDPANVPKVLPSCLAVPLYGLYETHGYAPVQTYADFVTNNWKLKDPSRPVQIENVECIIDFPGDEDWVWFHAVGVMIEYSFVPALQGFQNVMDGIDDDDEEKVTRSLEVIKTSFNDMLNTTKRFHEKMSVEGFFVRVATFFTGWDDKSPLPNGLIYEGVQDEPIKMQQASAGQSAIIHSLDALLGIEHEKDGQVYTKSIGMYLEPSHRQFLLDIRQRPRQLKEFVESSSCPELKASYHNLVKALVGFRTYHLQLVSKYIITGKAKYGGETKPDDMSLKNLMTFLKGMRDDCKTDQ